MSMKERADADGPHRHAGRYPRRKPRESNDVLSETGWDAIFPPVAVDLEPARF